MFELGFFAQAAAATAAPNVWAPALAIGLGALLIGLGFAEAIAIYALVIAFILVGKV